MTTAREQADDAVSRRPRDRKGQIAAAAATLFCERGYHGVGVDDVAAAVGITGGAIYRHFANKGDLLARTVSDALDDLDGVLGATPPDAGAAEVVRALAAFAVDRRHVAVLLDREARHLRPAELAAAAERTATTAARLRTAVGRARPELADADLVVLVRSALAVLASPAYHRVTLPPVQAEALLVSTASTVLGSTVLPRPVVDAAPLRSAAAAAARREALLAAATTLFARNGYPAVTMEEIGAAAGIAGTSIYQHFASKADLLAAAFNRGAEWLQFGVSQALGAASDDRHALELVVRSYADFVVGHTDLMGLLLTEFVHLPAGETEILRRTQHDYVGEWVDLLRRVRPALSEPEARFRTHAALAIINDVARPGRGPIRPDVDGILTGLALEALAT